MLQGVLPKVRECLEKASDCRRKAQGHADPELREFWGEMEERWLRLARSYDHVASTEAFLSHLHQSRWKRPADR